MKKCLTRPMQTSLILRADENQSLPSAVLEVSRFRFTPFSRGDRGDGDEPPAAGVSLERLVAWHNAHPRY